MADPALRRALQSGEFVTAPGVFELISALIADSMGFKALYVTGYGTVASYLGLPDAGLATYTDMIDRIAELAEKVRREGPLSLDNMEIDDPFLSKGAQYVADGYDPVFIQEALELERDQTLERLDEGQRIYKAIGDAAPAFGMIGTIVGLVQMLSNMEDPSTIGPAMAVALLTTLYGAVIANLVALPISDKLSTKGKITEVSATLTIDGVMQLAAGKNPALIREMLVAYLPEKTRLQLAQAAGAAEATA
mgnify:CR=1 FL=1